MERFAGLYDVVIFTDSFDSFLVGSIEEIIEKFRAFGHPMIVSGAACAMVEAHSQGK